MTVSQRPLSLGEILDHTVQLYRRNFLQFCAISALPAAVMVLIFGAAGIFLSKQSITLKPDSDGIFAFILVITLIILVGLPIMVAAFALALSASNYAVLMAHQGTKTTIRGAYAYAFHHFWRHLWLLFLQVLAAWIVPYCVFLGLVVVGVVLAAAATKAGAGVVFIPILILLLVLLMAGLLVACILLWLRFSLAFPVSVAEEKPAWPSMLRSGRLSKGTRGRIFVMFLLVWAVSIAVSVALLIPLIAGVAIFMRKSLAGPTPPPAFLIILQVANFGVSFLVRALVTPIYSIALMLFYYDQRTRTEGYDIEQLMLQAGYAQLPPAPMPPATTPPIMPPTQPPYAYPQASPAGYIPAYPPPAVPAVTPDPPSLAPQSTPPHPPYQEPARE